MNWAQAAGPGYSICFVVTFLAVAIWESRRARGVLTAPTERRWMSHGVMLVLATVLTTVALRVGPVVLSAMVADRPWGLLNRAWMPAAVSFGLTIVLMDLLQYGVHWSFHHVGFLWRIHRVHHSDPDFDVSTAGRFHPLEAMVTQGVHLVAVALLAPPPAAMLASLLLTAVLNLWTHANASLSAGWERVVRGALITPDLHRIHHSERMREQQTNYGQTFSCWDRLFGTFVGKAEAPEGEFRTGLDDLEGADPLSIRYMLTEPFRRDL